ncbi:C40 family peptidase [Glutamicibacter ardleyensis]|uniref:C40 family peptidase n=1 Tax=Glutamicibacter ardleyensis TaxID=225894 RepID=UPI003FD1250A
MYWNRSNTTFSVTLIALLATPALLITSPDEPKDITAVAVTTYKVNPYAVAPVHAHYYEVSNTARASFSAYKTVDPKFHYDLDSPSSMEVDGQLGASFPAELVYEWPAEETDTPSSPVSGESQMYESNDSDAMVRPEYRGKIIAVSDKISPIAPDSLRQKIVDISLKYQGSPYVWGGNTPMGWDCSGFVKYVYGKAGVNTARTTSSIRASGQFRRTTTPQPGDLVFQNNGGHVGIYLGNGKMVGAQNPSVGTIVHQVSRNPLYGYFTLKK